MVLQQIKDVLKDLDNNVFYGMVHSRMKETLWNYIVFNRTTLGVSANKTGYTDTYQVHIVREDFIPEGLDVQVIEKMKEIAGFRLAGEGQYTYVQKNNTDTVIEMLTLEFVKPRKA